MVVATFCTLTVPRSSNGPLRSHARQHQRTSTAVNNGVTNNGVYGDDGDLISSQHIGVSQVPLREGAVVAEVGGVTCVVQHIWPFWQRRRAQRDGLTTGFVGHGMKMAASGPAFGFGSPGLEGMPCGLSMAQLA